MDIMKMYIIPFFLAYMAHVSIGDIYRPSYRSDRDSGKSETVYYPGGSSRGYKPKTYQTYDRSEDKYYLPRKYSSPRSSSRAYISPSRSSIYGSPKYGATKYEMIPKYDKHDKFDDREKEYDTYDKPYKTSRYVTLRSSSHKKPVHESQHHNTRTYDRSPSKSRSYDPKPRLRSHYDDDHDDDSTYGVPPPRKQSQGRRYRSRGK